ncbi:hypothetical protein [Mycetocola reblochoni]|uniref:Pentapeptide repeat-containing protein n=1 Tax=Mycetocola reblochoni REB411 TaxID=1255698 RepID=A0A1R4IDD9_9MICO|nr:hypothetical protein [Mycetocola reblochoni]SJN17838.1 hypothetical protein FM119_01185 [Mycetocola reblochoni REB411]
MRPHRLGLHRLDMHRLDLHRLDLHRLDLHRLDLSAEHRRRSDSLPTTSPVGYCNSGEVGADARAIMG